MLPQDVVECPIRAICHAVSPGGAPPPAPPCGTPVTRTEPFRRAAAPTIMAMKLGGLTRVHSHITHHHSYGSGGSGSLPTPFLVVLILVAVVALVVWAVRRGGGS